MEQRTFLAIVISFLFLMVYNSLVISPQQKAKPNNPTNISTNNIKNVVDTATPAILDKNGSKNHIFEKVKELKIGNFTISFEEHSGIFKKFHSDFSNYSSILTNYLVFNPNQQLKSYTSSPSNAVFLYQYRDISWKIVMEAIDNNKLKSRLQFISNPGTAFDLTIFDIDSSQIIKNTEIMRDSMLFEFSHLIDNKIFRKGHAFKFTPKDSVREIKSVEWFGWRDRYYFNVIRPLFKCSEFSTNYKGENQLNIQINNCKYVSSNSYEFEMYVGPQDLKLLNSFDGNIKKIMAFSGNGILDYIEKLIYKILININKFINNWGLSIIVISVLIYAITYPLTLKSMVSMKRMQELQPKMQELREKHKNDPQKLNAEVVQLYRVNNINPLGGCLPMILQMPVFISLYQVLWRTHDFQNAHFLWIKDLSKPDRAFIINQKLPFIGNELNILPILMAVVMFFQQKLSTKNAILSDPSQVTQQKMMIWIFPIFIGGIFYHFASGLTLYFTIFYFLSALMQYKMSKTK